MRQIARGGDEGMFIDPPLPKEVESPRRWDGVYIRRDRADFVTFRGLSEGVRPEESRLECKLCTDASKHPEPINARNHCDGGAPDTLSVNRAVTKIKDVWVETASDCLAHCNTEWEEPEAPSLNEEAAFVAPLSAREDLKSRWEQIASEQRADDVLNKIIVDVEARNARLRPNRRRSGNDIDGYELLRGLLYRVTANKQSNGPVLYKRRLCLPKKYHDMVLHTAHDSNMTGGHLGLTKTHSKLVDRYFWPNMYTDTADYIQRCDICERRRQQPSAYHVGTGTVEAAYPWETIAMDILGPITTTKRHFRYILVITDVFTRQVEVRPLVAIGSHEIADVLVDEIFCRYGTPARILTDQASNFTGALIEDLCSAMKIRKIRTSAYNPRCNGMVERFNKTLASMLAAYIGRYANDWDIYLQAAVAAYRFSVHSVTKETPFFLTFGRHPLWPIDMYFPQPPDEVPNTVESYRSNLVHHLRGAWKIAYDNTVKNRETTRKDMTDRLTIDKYPIGSSVWVATEPRTVSNSMRQASKKFAARWRGPYIVLEQHPPSLLRLGWGARQELDGLVNIRRVKPYREPNADAMDLPPLFVDENLDEMEERQQRNELPESARYLADTEYEKETPRVDESNEGGEPALAPGYSAPVESSFQSISLDITPVGRSQNEALPPVLIETTPTVAKSLQSDNNNTTEPLPPFPDGPPEAFRTPRELVRAIPKPAKPRGASKRKKATGVVKPKKKRKNAVADEQTEQVLVLARPGHAPPKTTVVTAPKRKRHEVEPIEPLPKGPRPAKSEPIEKLPIRIRECFSDLLDQLVATPDTLRERKNGMKSAKEAAHGLVTHEFGTTISKETLDRWLGDLHDTRDMYDLAELLAHWCDYESALKPPLESSSDQYEGDEEL